MAARASGARNLIFRITWPESFLDENGVEQEHPGLPLLDPSRWPDCTYCVYQLEIGDETSRIHYQGYVEFTGQKRYNWVQNNCAGMESAHLETRRGTMEEARNYAMKHDTRLDGPWEWGRAKESKQGERSDLRAVRRAIDEGRPMCYIADNFFGSFLRYERGLRSYYRLHSKGRDWAMEIIVLVGPSGTGKSRWARDNAGDSVFWKDGSKWWDGYEGQHTVVWDEFYAYCCPFSVLLRLLDRYPLSIEIKGGFQNFVSRRIIFTTNQDPSEWYNAERTHQGPWDQNPLHRRVREFGRVIRTGAVHAVNQQPHNWDGTEYVDLYPPPVRAPEFIAEPMDLDNPNEYFYE